MASSLVLTELPLNDGLEVKILGLKIFQSRASSRNLRWEG